MNMQEKTTVNQVNFNRHIKVVEEKPSLVNLRDITQLVRF